MVPPHAACAAASIFAQFHNEQGALYPVPALAAFQHPQPCCQPRATHVPYLVPFSRHARGRAAGRQHNAKPIPVACYAAGVTRGNVAWIAFARFRYCTCRCTLPGTQRSSLFCKTKPAPSGYTAACREILTFRSAMRAFRARRFGQAAFRESAAPAPPNAPKDGVCRSSRNSTRPPWFRLLPSASGRCSMPPKRKWGGGKRRRQQFRWTAHTYPASDSRLTGKAPPTYGHPGPERRTATACTNRLKQSPC